MNGWRILVVDDNVDAAESLSMFLQLSGHDTRIAHSGPEGIDAARAFQPEVVFLDIGLPGMNGYEIARRLRQEGALLAAMLIAVTGWGTEEDKKKAIEAGFDFHLTKPVETNAIEGLLFRVSDRRRAQSR